MDGELVAHVIDARNAPGIALAIRARNPSGRSLSDDLSFAHADLVGVDEWVLSRAVRTAPAISSSESSRMARPRGR
jgi:hypothetical protein